MKKTMAASKLKISLTEVWQLVCISKINKMFLKQSARQKELISELKNQDAINIAKTIFLVRFDKKIPDELVKYVFPAIEIINLSRSL